MELIKVDKLTKKYRDVLALNEVSLNIEEGNLYGLLGVNGAGKTTLIKILSGLTRKTSGNAYVKGYSLDEMDEIKKIVDISPQEVAVALNLTVYENLLFFQELYGKKDKDYLDDVIHSLGLNDVLKKKAKTLSGGYQRRLSIAIGLMSKPEILFLDEPTLGLDVISRRELWNIIRKLKGKITIILTSHYLEEIEALCDKISVMSKGNILFEGTVDEIKEKTNEDSFEEAFIKIVGGNN